MAAKLKPGLPDVGVSEKRQIRVIHIVENLNGQAVETWLLRVLRVAASLFPNVRWTFFCALGTPGKFDDEARKLGAEVIHSPHAIGDKVNFTRSLRRTLKLGRYDVLHAHHDIMSAAYLIASLGLPIKKRIIHLHNTSLSLPTPSRTKARIAHEPMRRICLTLADQVVGASNDALASFVGNSNPQPENIVVHYAVDTARFEQSDVSRDELRLRLGIARTARVLLFAGRIIEYKNPCFVVEILEKLMRNESNAVAVFAGKGDYEERVRELARMKNLEDRVHLLGFRDDLPELMLASDVLIWPSLEEPKEGLGLGIIEAQSAGLPILMSRSVPEEAVVIPELVDVQSLAEGAEAWADRIAEILERKPFDRNEALRRVEESSFSMKAGVHDLMALYDDV